MRPRCSSVDRLTQPALFVIVDALHGHAATIRAHHGLPCIPDTLRLIQKIPDIAAPLT